MTEERATGTCNACWTYDTLLLINSLKMVPWCRNTYELSLNVKCTLWSVLLYFN